MEITCLLCYHFPVCQVHIRAKGIDCAKDNVVDFFKKEAENCDYYEPSDGGNHPSPREPLIAS